MTSAGTAGAMETELGWAASLLAAWLEVLVLGQQEPFREPGRRALDRFETFDYAAAIFQAGAIRFTNEAWRQLFKEVPPSWATPSIEEVTRTNVRLHVPEVFVDVDGRRVWIAATLVPCTQQCGVLVCAEMTDAAISRELGAAPEAGVWSGSTARPARSDYCNRSLRQYAGPDTEEGWQAFVHPDDVPSWEHAVRDAMANGVSGDIDLRLRRHADGKYRWHSVRVVTATSNKRWFSVAVDCHHQRSLERERSDLLDRLRAARVDAEQANRIKDQVLAAVSHELRAPLTTMVLWERVLRDPGADDGARAQALDAIRQSTAAQSRLVADLLDMSRAISGKLYVDFRNVEVGKLIDGAVEACLPAANAKGITLTHESTFEGEISGDASRLRQVIDNVLSNALKFTDPGGRITVTTQAKGRVVAIVVEDNGRGIARSQLTRIFEPFSQGRDAVARREGGLGLGLAISKQIVELHHGTLTAFSEGPGHGARFTLMLPMAGHRRAPSPPAGVVSPAALKSVRVLVVDDDDRVTTALALLLDRAGAIVDRARSAQEARQQLSRHVPQVILCDIAMPDEDGYEFIRSLRASGSKIPAIALTAYASQADAQQALAAGFDLHVAKPVDFQRLVASLTHVIESRARDSMQ